MGCRLMGRRPTFISMMFLTTSFFLVEIIVGYITNSMALIADSFHMLSDIISLVVGYFALKLSRKSKEHLIDGNTFGWVRAEVLGALVNAVFLVALCLSILISALKRLVEPEPLHKPILILIVGSVGLLVNLFGMLLFHGHAGHGHSHGGGHGHSHGGGHSHSHEGSDDHYVRTDLHNAIENGIQQQVIATTGHAGHGHSHEGGHGHSHGGDCGHSHGSSNDHCARKDLHNTIGNGIQQVVAATGSKSLTPLPLPIPHSPSMLRFQERTRRVEVILNADVNIGVLSLEEDPTVVVKERHPAKAEGQLNMKGVYLHILGDALGSIIVIVAALIVHFVKMKWTLYVDPVMSIIMVGIILYSSVPLLKESSKILLQNVPSHIQLKQLEARLLSTFPEIIGVHEFHVWQLAGSKIIASVHVKFNSNADYNRLSPNLKEFFHYEGIHSTTFQPEFEEGNETSIKRCLLACDSKSCEEKLCCSLNSVDKGGSDGELVSNEHVVPESEIRITVDEQSFHMQETSTSMEDNCMSDDELLTNKLAEQTNEVTLRDGKCCGNHEHTAMQSETTNVSNSPAIIESIDLTNTVDIA